MKRPRLSLRARVVLAIAAVALAPHALVFAWTQLDRPVPGRLWANVRDAMQDARAGLAEPSPDLGAIAARRGVRLRVADARTGAVGFDADADSPTGPGDRVEAFFLRPTGAPTLREIDDGMGPLLARDEVRFAREHGTFVGCRYDDLLFCEAVAATKDARGEDRIVYVQQSSYRAVGEVYQLRWQLLRMGLLLWPVAVLLAWLTGGRIVRPIERLRRQALDRSRPAGAPKLALDSGDEVADLATALNGLIGEVESERRRHEEFVADLVHELKGTAASVRASADALDAADERTARLARVLRDSSAKLETTVARFLDLARAEDGFPREAREKVDVAATARALVERMREDARFCDVTFDVDADGEASVAGVAYRIESMIRELLENGASFVPRGGRVALSVRASERVVEILVEDDGPGIPDAEREEVFRRYYTTRGHARGTGLGLALVRAVAQAHGGRAEALGGRDRGAAFRVVLPRFTPNSHDAP